MKRKTILRGILGVAVFLAAIALITGVALARTGSGAAGNHGLNATMLSGGHYQLTTGVLRSAQANAGQENVLASGGHYRLMEPARQENELASGGHYHLQEPSNSGITGSGCCCLYLPCILH
jgi:hypothetical protein